MVDCLQRRGLILILHLCFFPYPSTEKNPAQNSYLFSAPISGRTISFHFCFDPCQIVLSEDPLLPKTPDSPMTSLPSDSFCSTVSILFNSVATTHSGVAATTKGGADSTLSTQFNQHTLSHSVPTVCSQFNQHTLSVCSTHIAFRFLFTLQHIAQLTFISIAHNKNYAFFLHLVQGVWNGCIMPCMEFDTRISGICAG